jgi:hypothetical protein
MVELIRTAGFLSPAGAPCSVVGRQPGISPRLHWLTRHRLPLAFSFLGVSAGMGHGEVAGFEGVITLKRGHFGVLTDTPVLAGGGPALGDTVDVTVWVEAVKAPAALMDE